MKLSEMLRAHLEHIYGRTIPDDVAYVIRCVEQYEREDEAIEATASDYSEALRKLGDPAA